MELATDPAFTFSTKERILSVEFSPFEWSRALIAVGHEDSVAVYSVTFKEETEEDCFSCKHIWECQVVGQPLYLAWHPSSSLRGIQQCLRILVGTSCYSVIEVKTYGNNEHILEEIVYHNDCVNSVAYSPDGNCVFGASTGDDLVAMVWDCSTKTLIAKFLLTSPGMSVKFHSSDPDSLLVAERCGTIRVYSISNNYTNACIQCSPTPILSADWSVVNPSLVFAVGPAGATLVRFGEVRNLKRSVTLGGKEGAVVAALTRSGEQTAAVITSPNTFKLVSLSTMKVPLSVHLKSVAGISWHAQLSYVAVGSGTKVHLWKNNCV